MATDKPGVLDYRKAMNDIITSRYATLSQTLDSSMETFPRYMFEVKLVDRGAMRCHEYFFISIYALANRKRVSNSINPKITLMLYM